MRILVNGLPYFSKKLVDDLTEYDPKNRYLFLNTYQSIWAKIKFLLFLPFFDKVISMNGVSDESGSLNWVVRLNKPLLMIWQGTDVMLAVERQKYGSIYSKYINHASHYAVAPWLVDELKTIEIESQVLSFIWFPPIKTQLKSAEKFAVLTYLAKGKEDFYGWKVLKEAFTELKDIQLFVVGSDGETLEYPENITFFGWVGKDKMRQLQEKSTVLVRMTEHDGNSHFVSEALSVGLEVIWNYPHPCAFLANDSDSVIAQINTLYASFNENGGEKNSRNIDWVRSNLAKNTVLRNVVEKIQKHE